MAYYLFFFPSINTSYTVPPSSVPFILYPLQQDFVLDFNCHMAEKSDQEGYAPDIPLNNTEYKLDEGNQKEMVLHMEPVV
jgi:hypothetical protein